MVLCSDGFDLSHKGLEMKGWDPQNNWKIRADGAGSSPHPWAAGGEEELRLLHDFTALE